MEDRKHLVDLFCTVARFSDDCTHVGIELRLLVQVKKSFAIFIQRLLTDDAYRVRLDELAPISMISSIFQCVRLFPRN